MLIQHHKMIRAGISWLLIILLSVSSPGFSYARTIISPNLPVNLSSSVQPVLLQGLLIQPDKPLVMDFVIDPGNIRTSAKAFKDESMRLIQYFMAGLTIPEKDMWVNLSPYEKNRIIPQSFGQTALGQDLLSQDYVLKQITAALLYPDGETGKKFWAEVYRQAAEKFGTTNIPVEALNKVWITPDKAVVHEDSQSGAVFVVASRLKVMLESDYMAFQRREENRENISAVFQTSEVDLAHHVMRDIVIPVLEKEVNESASFATLRQVYHALILAAWYKKKMTGSFLSAAYVDRNKIAGITTHDPKAAARIWAQYVETFRKGVYNVIREDVDPVTQETVPRKYFSGGMTMDLSAVLIEDQSPYDSARLAATQTVRVRFDQAQDDGKGKHKINWHRDFVVDPDRVFEMLGYLLNNLYLTSDVKKQYMLMQKIDELVSTGVWHESPDSDASVWYVNLLSNTVLKELDDLACLRRAAGILGRIARDAVDIRSERIEFYTAYREADQERIAKGKTNKRAAVNGLIRLIEKVEQFRNVVGLKEKENYFKEVMPVCVRELANSGDETALQWLVDYLARASSWYAVEEVSISLSDSVYSTRRDLSWMTVWILYEGLRKYDKNPQAKKRIQKVIAASGASSFRRLAEKMLKNISVQAGDFLSMEPGILFNALPYGVVLWTYPVRTPNLGDNEYVIRILHRLVADLPHGMLMVQSYLNKNENLGFGLSLPPGYSGKDHIEEVAAIKGMLSKYIAGMTPPKDYGMASAESHNGGIDMNKTASSLTIQQDTDRAEAASGKRISDSAFSLRGDTKGLVPVILGVSPTTKMFLLRAFPAGGQR